MNSFLNKKLIIIGNQQYLFVYVFLVASLFGSIIFYLETKNIFSLASILLLFLILILAKFKQIIFSIILLILIIVMVWLGEGGGEEIYLHWYSGLPFCLSMLIIIFLISINEDNKLLRKPWDEVSDILSKRGASLSEIEKFKEYWRKNRF